MLTEKATDGLSQGASKKWTKNENRPHLQSATLHTCKLRQTHTDTHTTEQHSVILKNESTVVKQRYNSKLKLKLTVI